MKPCSFLVSNRQKFSANRVVLSCTAVENLESFLLFVLWYSYRPVCVRLNVLIRKPANSILSLSFTCVRVLLWCKDERALRDISQYNWLHWKVSKFRGPDQQRFSSLWRRFLAKHLSMQRWTFQRCTPAGAPRLDVAAPFSSERPRHRGAAAAGGRRCGGGRDR